MADDKFIDDDENKDDEYKIDDPKQPGRPPELGRTIVILPCSVLDKLREPMENMPAFECTNR